MPAAAMVITRCFVESFTVSPFGSKFRPAE